MEISLCGTYKLVTSCTYSDSGQQIRSIWGDSPEGFLIYTPQGYMSVQVLRTDRGKFYGEDARTGSISEVFSAFEGFNSYYGKYLFDTKNNTVTHFIERDLIPNFDGSQVSRAVTFNDELLILRTPLQPICGIWCFSELVWKKLECLGGNYDE